ncbi:MAG: glycosyltransferase family 2 protein [Candidatus Kerfeldbacteria bacterium]
MSRIDTSIVIVNWNGLKHLQVCFESLLKQSYTNFNIIFVDNGSVDDSVGFIKDNFPQVTIIQLKKNFGFAEGNNMGIREALKNNQIQYIVALNNDTEVKSDWLENLITVVKHDKMVGVVASKTLFFDQRDKIDSAGDFFLAGTMKVVTRGYQEIDKGQYNNIQECFSARAAAVLYKTEMLKSVELHGDYFDSNFFAYIEDTDLSIRARLMGWKILYSPKAIVYHKVAATSSNISHAFRKYYSGRNRLFTMIKNYPVKLWPKVMNGSESVDRNYSLSFIKSLYVYIKIILLVLFSFPSLLVKRKIIQNKKKINTQQIYDWVDKFSLNNQND